MRNIYIPLLIVWTVVIILQQAAIFTFQAHIHKQRDLLMKYQISLCECINVTENCVKILTREKGLFDSRKLWLKGGG